MRATLWLRPAFVCWRLRRADGLGDKERSGIPYLGNALAAFVVKNIVLSALPLFRVGGGLQNGRKQREASRSRLLSYIR